MSPSYPNVLPKTGALESFLRARALHDVDDFVAIVPGVAVLVRLDERGGVDEGARWAIPTLDDVEVDDDDVDSGDNVFFDPQFAAGSDEATAAGPAQPPLAIPPARERATVYVVDGSGRVGRSSSCAVRLAERSVSRKHALLGVEPDRFTLVDLESDNGTGVNGMLLVPGIVQPLRSGDVVHLGDLSFVFLDTRALYTHLPALCGQ